MNFIYNLFPEELLNAIGWTLINSVWQGIIIGAILFTALCFIPDKHSGLRYNISLIALGLIILSAIFNFIFEIISSSGITETIVNLNPGNNSPLLSTGTDFPEDKYSLSSNILGITISFMTLLKSNFSIVIILWLIGILVFATRFFGGFSYVKRMKYMDSRFVPAKWQNKLNSFRYSLKLTKPVRLFESAKTTVPVVIGYAKPVILLPIGMLTGFAPNQVEAILAHELAHVLRNDYLVNIIQSVAEIIFFYNPAVWWISSTIGKEREKCCDDVAVSLCGDSLLFARALAKVEEFNQGNHRLALALNGKQNLVARINRLLQNKKGNTMIEKSSAAGIIAILMFTATVFATTLRTDGIQSHFIQINQIEEPELSAAESITANVTSESIESVGISETLNIIEPAFELASDLPSSDEFLDSTIVKDKIVEKRELTSEEKKLLREQEAKMREQEKLMRIQEEKMREQEKLMRAQEEKMQQLEAEMRIQEDKIREQEKVMRIEEKKMREEEKKMRIEEEQMREQEKKMRIEEEKMREAEKKMRIEEEKIRVEEEKMRQIEEKFMGKLSDLLLQKGIITDKEKYSLKLNPDELYVNGIKQSNDLHQEVKKMYEEVSGSELEGNFSYHITQETDN